MPQRPGGVTAIAVIEFIGAGFLVLFGILAALGGSLAGIFMGNASHRVGGGVIAALGIGVSILFFCLAGIYIFVATGMLKLKNWARIVTIVFAGLSFLSGGLFFFVSHGLLFTSLFRVALAGWVIWYLVQPHVKAAFGASGSAL